MTNEAPPGPATIMHMFQGVQASAVLAAGIDVGVFGALAGGSAAADAVAERIRCPARTTRLLLDALTVLGLVEADGASYKLAPVAARSPRARQADVHGRRRGHLREPDDVDEHGPARRGRARGRLGRRDARRDAGAPVLGAVREEQRGVRVPGGRDARGPAARPLAGRPKVRVLDIACGSGIYGYTLAKHPNVELTSLDWPNVLEETRAWGKRLGVDAARVKYLPGNLFEVDYGGPYDVVVLSHVFHHFDAPTCASLMRKAAAALAPGGRVAVHDFLSDDPGGKMFSIVMLGWTRKGEAFKQADYLAWFEQAGLSAPEVHPSAGMPSSFLIASRR